MTLHKYAAGDRVAFIPGTLDRNVRRGLYTVVRPLPITSQGCQYRVRNVQDEHERVVDEVQLRLAP
jgi:hypothetical protein